MLIKHDNYFIIRSRPYIYIIFVLYTLMIKQE